jgi:site-specific DNA recombinase
MKAAAYCRYSSDLQRSTSIEDQLAGCTQYAEQHGWTLDQNHIYTDAAVSGASIEGRPGVQALLRAIATSPPPFDVLLVDDSSRISRDISDAVRFLQQVTFFGVRAIYISQSIDSANEQAETLVAVHGVVDSLYLKELAKKVRRGTAGQLRRGFATGGRTCGYRTRPVIDDAGRQDPDGQPTIIGKSIHVHEAEARVVRAIFEEYAGGIGVGAIVDRLNRNGVRGPRGRAWRYGAVQRLLRNERYRGVQIWGQHTYERRPGTNRQVCRPLPRSQWQTLDRPDLRIVSDDLWQRVQARITEIAGAVETQPGRTLMRGRNAALHSRHLFSGLMRCAVCGGGITTVTSGHGSPRYGCYHSWRNGVSGCSNRLTVRAKVADQVLVAGVRAELLRPDMLQYVTSELTAALNRVIDARPTVRADLEAQRSAVQGRLQNLVEAIEAGHAAPALLQAISAREAELGRLDAQLADLDEPLRDKLAVIPGWVRQQLEDVAGLLGDNPVRTRAEFRRLGVSMTVEPVRDEGRPFLRATGSVDFSRLAFSRYFPGSISGRSDPGPGP